MTTLRLDPFQEFRKANGDIIPPSDPRRQKTHGGPVWYQDESKQNEDVDIERLVLDVVNETGKLRDVSVEKLIVDGEIVRTMDGASTFSISLHDPDQELLQTGIFDRAIDVNLDGLWFRLVRVEKQGSILTLEFEDRFVAYLRLHNRVKRASRNTMTRLEFCLSLVRSVKQQRIPVVAPELHIKQPIKSLGRQEEKAVARDVTQPGVNKEDGLTVKGAPADDTQIMVAEQLLDTAIKMDAHQKIQLALMMTATQESRMGKELKSSSGIHVGPLHQDSQPGSTWRQLGGARQGTSKAAVRGQAHAFVRVARSVLADNPGIDSAELALRVQRPGGGSQQYGQWKDEARKWVESFGGRVGGPDENVEGEVSRAYRKRYSFTTEEGNRVGGKKLNYWDAIQGLLAETQFRAFSSNGYLYMISETQLFRGKTRMVLNHNTPGVTEINFTWDVGEKEATATVTARAARWIAPPGSIIKLVGCGPANGRWLVESIRRNVYARDAEIILKKPTPKLAEPAPEIGTTTVAGDDKPGLYNGKNISTAGGARGIVDQAFAIASEVSATLYVGSDLRSGDTLPSGQLSDHANNNSTRAARDIGKRGVDLLVGPPSGFLDQAVVQIGKAFGRDYGDGKRVIIDTFNWKGYRIQIIWRTPKYGGHMGHIHIGALKQ